jgi:hypothetical protein
MRPSTLLRFACVLAVLQALGHVAGSVARGAVRGEQEAALFAAMRAFEFDAMGARSSHFDFYVGYELLISAAMVFHAALLWQLGALVRDAPRHARRLIATCLLAYLVFVALYWIHFFAGPILLASSILVCLALAWLLVPGDEI